MPPPCLVPYALREYLGGMIHSFRIPAIVFALAGLASAAMAQITITSADMPMAGDTVRFRNSATTADMADTGPGHQWDFSGLQPLAEGADTAVTVGSTPLLYQFFFNNALLYPQHKADFAMRGPAIGAQGVTVEDLYDYFKSNSAGFRNVGFGATINGLPTSVQRDPVDWIYRFPLNYGDQDSSFSHFQIAVPTLGYYGQDQLRRNEVDGWGTLILPADTFQVLRVKSRIERTDTVYIEQFGIGFALPVPEIVEYKWLAPGMDEPVLQVTNMGGANTLVRFFHAPEDITTAVFPPAASEGMKVWPNPADRLIHVDGYGPGILELRAADGRLVRSMEVHGQGTAVLDVGGLAPGTYLLHHAVGGKDRRVLIIP